MYSALSPHVAVCSLGELYGITKSITTSMLITILLVYTTPLNPLSRSIYILSWLFIIVFIGGSRLAWRILRNYIVKEVSQESKRTLIIGAGDAGAIVARELSNNSSLGLVPVGFVDDSYLKQKLTLYGIPVLGTRKNIPNIVNNYGIEEIIIAMPSASGKAIREIMSICPLILRHVCEYFQGGSGWLNDNTDNKGNIPTRRFYCVGNR